MARKNKIIRELVISPILAIGGFSVFYGISNLLGLFNADPYWLIIIGSIIVFISIKLGWKR